jgi:signal transduction histidine kinase
MNVRLRSQPPSLRLLLTLEWLLLGIVAIAEGIVGLLSPESVMRIGNGVGLLIFAGSGIVWPQKSMHKLLYTSLEFGLIILLALIGTIPLFQLLFIVLVTRNCLLLEGRSRSIVTGITFLANAGCQLYRLLYRNFLVNASSEQVWLFWLGTVLSFGLVILFLQLLVEAVIMERKSQEQLAAAHTQLQQYALQIEALATVQERNRIARDIHDSLGHSLTVFNLHLGAAIRLLPTNPEKAMSLLHEIKELGAQALEEVSQSVTSLRADPLDSQSLSTAVDHLIQRFHRSTGILPDSEIKLDQLLSKPQNTAIYRLIQEALTNISKYAAATQVTIRVRQTQALIQVSIQDNGQGFELDQNTTGFGLQGMRERVQALAGEFTIHTALGQGCLIMASLPIQPEQFDL